MTTTSTSSTCYDIDQALGLLPDANQQLLDQEQQGTAAPRMARRAVEAKR